MSTKLVLVCNACGKEITEKQHIMVVQRPTYDSNDRFKPNLNPMASKHYHLGCVEIVPKTPERDAMLRREMCRAAKEVE